MDQRRTHLVVVEDLEEVLGHHEAVLIIPSDSPSLRLSRAGELVLEDCRSRQR